MRNLLYLFCLFLALPSLRAQKDQPNNILFLAVDDLKPLLSNYGHQEMHTPNFDRLAAMGVTFTNAHVQYAVCGPSRASIMTGCYPDRTRVWDLHTDFRKSSDNLQSMPEYLVSQGYETVGIGKIYHKGSSAPGHDGKSWSMGHSLPSDYNVATGPPVINYQHPANKARYVELLDEAKENGAKIGKMRDYALAEHKPSTESAPVPDDAYQDGVYTKNAIAKLKMLKEQDKPWLLALGWQRPHLPFVAPQKYWDLYQREDIKLSGVQALAEGTPKVAYHSFGEIRSYTDFPQDARQGDVIPEAKQRELIHGYMACVSYIDAQLGKILDVLEAEGLADKTNIVLWGDHGFHLGDHTLWCKHSNFEQATRIPFMFAGPGVAKGIKVATPVNLLDAFPTLFELAGVPASAQAEGKSLVPLLDEKEETTIREDYAISQYHRGGKDNPIMGYSLRTERYRYTEWHRGYKSDQPYERKNIVGIEFYDYETDPLETKNFAEDPAYLKPLSILKTKLKKHLEQQRQRLSQPPATGSVPAGGGKGTGAIEQKPASGQPPLPTGNSYGVAPEAVSGAARPNVLFIHADDLGYHDLSHTGSRIYQTPNIDRLAASGIRFEQAYSNYPRCTPSRYALLTGTYPVNEDHGHLVGIPEERNFAKLWTQAGYHSFFVGKWHLGDENNSPLAFGFTDSYAAGHAGGVGQRFFPFNLKRNGKRHKEQVPDVEQDGKAGDYISDLLTDKTLDMLGGLPANKPFFGVLAFYAVHTPLEAKPADRARNEAEIAAFDFGEGPAYIKEGAGRRKMRQDDADYAGMVENVDENVGKILDYLEDKGLLKNTIVVFTSDHGGLSNDGFKWERHLATSNLPLRAGKGWLYEGGIRVPLIISWPEKISPGVDQSSIILGMDIYPTLLELAAGKQVADIDGKSAVPVLLGQEKWNDRTVFWHSAKARPHSTGDADMSAVRSGNYKLVQYNESGKTELYDLTQDQGEAQDQSARQPAKAAELKTLLDDWKETYLVPEKMKLRVKGK